MCEGRSIHPATCRSIHPATVGTCVKLHSQEITRAQPVQFAVKEAAEQTKDI